MLLKYCSKSLEFKNKYEIIFGDGIEIPGLVGQCAQCAAGFWGEHRRVCVVAIFITFEWFSG